MTLKLVSRLIAGNVSNSTVLEPAKRSLRFQIPNVRWIFTHGQSTPAPGVRSWSNLPSVPPIQPSLSKNGLHLLKADLNIWAPACRPPMRRLVPSTGFGALRHDAQMVPRFFSNSVRFTLSTPRTSGRPELHRLYSEKILQARRFVHLDRDGIQHFKRRGPGAWREALTTQRSLSVFVVVALGGVVIYTTNRQSVPFTHRKHFILISPRLERSVGERGFNMIMRDYKSKVLPANHPETVRVHRIADEIIEALMKVTRTDNWGQLQRGGDDLTPIEDLGGNSSKKPVLEAPDSHVHTVDEWMDDTWVSESRRQGLSKGSEGYVKHLENMKWRVVVVDDNIMNAVCAPGGKIVVFTGLLKKFRSDAEIATVLAHEVGHAVARHSAESLTHNIFLVAVQLIVLSIIYVPSLVNSVSELLLRLPFSRRMEIEADHIGLMLMAAAGYNPQLAPGFYEKLGKLDNSPEYAQYMSTHPSGKTRGEKLRNSATMAEAMNIYHQKIAGQDFDGYF